MKCFESHTHKIAPGSPLSSLSARKSSKSSQSPPTLWEAGKEERSNVLGAITACLCYLGIHTPTQKVAIISLIIDEKVRPQGVK